MKWLLLTTQKRTPETLGSNVGDEFACIGTENLIRRVDEDAQFDRLNVENPDEWNEREFDRCVFAGRPLWWSQRPGTDCVDHFWWRPIICGWPTRDPKKFMVLGAGSVCVDEIFDTVKYVRSIFDVRRRAWAVTTRNTVIDHPNFIDSVCPSAFSVPAYVGGGPKVCNLMVDGGHFPINSDEASVWESNFSALVATLKESGFVFVAHTQSERDLAVHLGWDDVKLFDSAQEYLNFYSTARCYFGNRLHGAAVCAAMGIPSFAVAYDSRMTFARRLGAMAEKPSDVAFSTLFEWMRAPWLIGQASVYLPQERLRLVELLREFKNQ